MEPCPSPMRNGSSGPHALELPNCCLPLRANSEEEPLPLPAQVVRPLNSDHADPRRFPVEVVASPCTGCEPCVITDLHAWRKADRQAAEDRHMERIFFAMWRAARLEH